MARTPSVVRYRIRNWRVYTRGLINRGRLTVWLDEQAIAAWRHTEPAAGPGAPRVYADLAIECALVFKSVYHLSLRAVQGFLSSVKELMRLPLPIPDYTTQPVERSHIPTRDRLRDTRGLRAVHTGQKFLESFEALHALRRGRVRLRLLVPTYRPTQATEHEKVRTVIAALAVLGTQLQKAA